MTTFRVATLVELCSLPCLPTTTITRLGLSFSDHPSSDTIRLASLRHLHTYSAIHPVTGPGNYIIHATQGLSLICRHHPDRSQAGHDPSTLRNQLREKVYNRLGSPSLSTTHHTAPGHRLHGDPSCRLPQSAPSAFVEKRAETPLLTESRTRVPADQRNVARR